MLSRLAIVVAVASLVCGLAFGQQTRPAEPPPSRYAPSPAAALNRLIAMLSEEGRALVETGELPRAHASAAADCPHDLPMAQVALRLTRPQHRDPVIDAYIRWQLTSFNPTLPEMRGRQFEKMLDDLPPLAENPRADRDLIAMMNRGLDAGPLNERDQTIITDTLNEMQANVSSRLVLSTAALELRNWLDQHYEHDLSMRILLAVERAHALVSAGWPLGSVGGDAEQLFEQASRSRDFTEEQRRQVVRAAQRVIGTSRVFVQSARVDEGRLEVNFANTGIYDFDVRRWIRRLEQR